MRYDSKSAVAQDQPVTLQTFYDQLSPYGQWVNYSPYGNVFVPNAGPGFVPYSTGGHWAYTDQFGWTWASDYPWGWACFHYGRWNYDQSYGWFWVPDTQWGPAWVVWRNSDQYYGWAPLPSGVDINIGISNGYGIPEYQWCFVPNQYMGDPFIYRYYMPPGNNDIFIMHSAVLNRMYFDGGHRYNYFAGPDRYEVERYRRGPIQPVVIRYNEDPRHVYGNNEMGMYRPTPVQYNNDRHDIVPARAIRIQDMPQRDAYHQHEDNGNHQGWNNNNGGDHRDDHHGNDNHPNNNGGNRGNDNHGDDHHNDHR